MPAPVAPISDQPLADPGTGTHGTEERMLAMVMAQETPPPATKDVQPPIEQAAPAASEPAVEAAPEEPVVESESEPTPEVEAPAVPLYTVIVDGKEAQVSVDELVAGYQRQADYTRKTQEVARQRESAESELKGLRETREKEAQVLTAGEQWLKAQMPAEEPDWGKLAQEVGDAEFNRQYALHAQQKERLGALQAKLAKVREDQQKDATEQYRQFVLGQEQRLVERLPAWKDAAKAKTDMVALAEYIKARFPETTDAEIAGTVDHRWWVLAQKARAYDDLLAKSKVVRPTSATPTVRPGAKAPPPKRADVVIEARDRLKETGRIEDATEAVFRMFETGVLK